MHQLTPRPVLAVADQFIAAHSAAMTTYRELVRDPADRHNQHLYRRALGKLVHWYANEHHAHERIAGDVAAADRYSLHIWLRHSGVEEACRCGA